ncbi:hypothetical protein ACQCVK_07015 [Rossellomorea vietnamensis]|uniref:hypothetical protein n=1 Tax=Rossellomorea vietnamensis TaxID=218284 RepID=UPI003CFA5BF3
MNNWEIFLLSISAGIFSAILNEAEESFSIGRPKRIALILYDESKDTRSPWYFFL